MDPAPARSADARYGLIAMATGLAVAVFVHLPPQAGDAPAWVGDACAAAFFCAGLSIFAAARRWPPLVSRLAGLFAAYVLVVPGAWVVLGGDPARCSVGAALGSFSLAGDAGALLCRSVFGFGTAVTLLIAGVFTWHTLRGKRVAEPATPPPPANPQG